MTSDQFITVRETAQLLGISEKKVMDLVKEEQLKAYKIADQFLRLKRNEVLNIRKSGTVEIENVQLEYTLAERVQDTLYFNDFYILSFLAILGLLYVIFFVV